MTVYSHTWPERLTLSFIHRKHLDTFHCGSVEKFKRLLEKMLVTYRCVLGLSQILTHCLPIQGLTIFVHKNSMHELFVIAVRFTLNHAHTHGKPVGEEDGHGHCPVHRVLSLSAADGVTLPGFAAFVDQIGTELSQSPRSTTDCAYETDTFSSQSIRQRTRVVKPNPSRERVRAAGFVKRRRA